MVKFVTLGPFPPFAATAAIYGVHAVAGEFAHMLMGTPSLVVEHVGWGAACGWGQVQHILQPGALSMGQWQPIV